MKLTKDNIDGLRTDEPKGEWFPDDELRGFFLVVYASGTKAFFVRYRTITGKRRVVKVGIYGTVTPQKARKRAEEILADAQLGGDVAALREAARNKPTWGTWVGRYFDRIKLQKKSPREDARFLGLTKGRAGKPTVYAQLLQRWRDRAVDEITREDIELFRTEVAKSGHPTAANRWLASVRSCLSAALKSGLISFNPALRMRYFAEAPPRARFLSDKEMTALLRAIAREKDVFAAAAMRVIIETGCRKSEILHATWADFDFENDPPTWRIPSPKAGHPQVMPLASSTVSLLKKLPKVGRYVVPSHRTVQPGEEEQPRKDIRGAWERALDRAQLENADIWTHDLRRTFGLMVTRDAGLHVASKLLRHADVTVTERVYAPLGLKELGEAMERRSTVLPFREKKGA